MNTEFWSKDGQLGLQLPDRIRKQLYSLCDAANGLETGSILVGHYENRHSIAVVTRLPQVPLDSESGPFHFVRGIKGLRETLERLWEKREYYLGEWHYHPNASPTPSTQDHRQMRTFAGDQSFKCPEPILLIVGGADPNWRLSAHVYPNGAVVELSSSSNGGRGNRR